MAIGDIIVFDEFKLALESGGHNLASGGDVLKLAILDATSTMAANTSSPAYGHANFVEIGTSGSYTAPVTLANQSLTNTTGTITFDADDPATWAQNALNDTDARWGLIYNDTNATDAAIAYIDFGSNVDMSAVDLTIVFNASGIFTLA